MTRFLCLLWLLLLAWWFAEPPKPLLPAVRIRRSWGVLAVLFGFVVGIRIQFVITPR